MTHDESEVSASATAWLPMETDLSSPQHQPRGGQEAETRANKSFLSEIHKEEEQKQERGLR